MTDFETLELDAFANVMYDDEDQAPDDEVRNDDFQIWSALKINSIAVKNTISEMHYRQDKYISHIHLQPEGSRYHLKVINLPTTFLAIHIWHIKPCLLVMWFMRVQIVKIPPCFSMRLGTYWEY